MSGGRKSPGSMLPIRSRPTLVTKRCHLIQIKPIFLTQAWIRKGRMLAKQTPSNYYYIIVLLYYYNIILFILLYIIMIIIIIIIIIVT